MELTKKAIDGFTYQGDGKSRDVRWDGALPGFGVRIYPSGQRSFVLSFRAAGRKRLLVLGRCGPLNVDLARNRARRHLSALLDGKDPQGPRQAEALGSTMAELCRVYMERHGSRKLSRGDDQRRIDHYILPKWRNLKLQAIGRAEIAALHHKIGKRAPYEANRVLALVRKMINCARQWGLLEEGRPNPATGIALHPEKPRERWLTTEELPCLAKAVDEETNTYVRGALWLYLLTGARQNELLAARWDGIDWQRKELRLGETKAGSPHCVPLSGPAVAVLKSLPRQDGNPYILPGAKAGQHLVNIAKPWGKIRRRAGIEDVRLHDLRRTVGRSLAQAGSDLHLIGQVLNHSNLGTGAIYGRSREDVLHRALEDHGQRIMAAAGKHAAAGNIV